MVNPAALLLLFGSRTWTFAVVEVNLFCFRHKFISLDSLHGFFPSKQHSDLVQRVSSLDKHFGI